VAVISIHTPEFDWEKNRAHVVQGAQRFGLTQPIYLDTDMAYWTALHNQYWPAFYLADKQGRIRLKADGEMHEGDADAVRFERMILRLLAER